ncbi:GAS2-like protein pickled eggs [Parasteatoda tepidariorum]|nr:GAS2-like protein pickled eggs [Parasteatoda tepidariorum]
MAVFDEEDTTAGRTRPRPFRPFRSHEEYLYAMKEDLAEWLQALYDLPVTADDFMEQLETGVVLCRHANRVIAVAKRRGRILDEKCREVVFRSEVQPGTFHARDNVHNFIAWCRGALKIKECLLFETDDLVMRKNEKNVVLCILEVARRGTKYGMPAPLLVQMEREIDAEIAAHRDDTNGESRTPPSSLSLRGDSDEGGHEADDDSESEPLATPRQPQLPQQQIVTNDLRSLHERVAELLNRCSCPAQFPMIRVGDGKYRIGETQLLIFVRILRNHVMVRVGGGWDTLEHYLDKHDPCRCKSGRRISVNRVSPSNSGSIQVHLNSHRPSSGTPSSSRSSSVPTSPPSRRRSFDCSRLSSSDDRNSSRSSSDDWAAPALRRGRGKSGRPSSADSSSEISETELCRGNSDFLRRQRRYSPRKVMKFGDNTCSEDAEDSSLEPQTLVAQQQRASPSRSRIPTSQSPSPQHRYRMVEPMGKRLSASRSETSLFQSAVNRGSRTPCQGPRRAVQSGGGRQRSSSSTRSVSSSPARTPEWNPKRRTLSLQSSPVKPVPPLLEEIINDSEVLDSDEKILERMQRLINEYRAREASPDTSLADEYPSPMRPLSKTMRRNSLSKIPVLTWNSRQ